MKKEIIQDYMINVCVKVGYKSILSLIFLRDVTAILACLIGVYWDSQYDGALAEMLKS